MALVVALLISIIITIITVLNGFNSVEKDTIKLMKTFGASKFQILITLIFPANIGTIISALKINIGLSWVGVIIGEFLVAKNGLGFLIVYGGQIAQLDTVMLSIIILAFIAFIMYKAIEVFEKKVISKKFKIHENSTENPKPLKPMNEPQGPLQLRHHLILHSTRSGVKYT